MNLRALEQFKRIALQSPTLVQRNFSKPTHGELLFAVLFH